MTKLQAVLFEIQMASHKDDKADEEAATAAALKSDSSTSLQSLGMQDENQNPLTMAQALERRRSSHSTRNILLKGEMRYLRETDLLIFLCSPL